MTGIGNATSGTISPNSSASSIVEKEVQVGGKRPAIPSEISAIAKKARTEASVNCDWSLFTGSEIPNLPLKDLGEYFYQSGGKHLKACSLENKTEEEKIHLQKAIECFSRVDSQYTKFRKAKIFEGTSRYQLAVLEKNPKTQCEGYQLALACFSSIQDPQDIKLRNLNFLKGSTCFHLAQLEENPEAKEKGYRAARDFLSKVVDSRDADYKKAKYGEGECYFYLASLNKDPEVQREYYQATLNYLLKFNIKEFSGLINECRKRIQNLNLPK